MLNQPTYDKLVKMRMSAMADAYRQQAEDPTVANLSFDERFAMVVDVEYWSRHNNRLKRNIHQAAFDQPHAALTDINYTAGRLLDRALIDTLGTCGNGSTGPVGNHPRKTQTSIYNFLLSVCPGRLVQQVPGGDHCGRHP